MLLGLSKIIDRPGASVPFSTAVDLSDLRYGISYPVTEPVRAEGQVRNTAGVLVMTGSIETTIHGTCDRCATAFDREIQFPIDVVLVTELCNEENEDEWVFPLEGDSADLEDIVRTVFVLNLDSKLLCSDDCKGLCCGCGRNLNFESCSCQKELDPRFAALKQLLEK
ncbi:MAG: DUF177 domain-containing protein [Oscillospiraceae bacterium]|nr:DUF177 domain-containing protein [Oscillospiraceae bacterium]